MGIGKKFAISSIHSRGKTCRKRESLPFLVERNVGEMLFMEKRCEGPSGKDRKRSQGRGNHFSGQHPQKGANREETSRSTDTGKGWWEYHTPREGKSSKEVCLDTKGPPGKGVRDIMLGGDSNPELSP